MAPASRQELTLTHGVKDHEGESVRFYDHRYDGLLGRDDTGEFGSACNRCRRLSPGAS